MEFSKSWLKVFSLQKWAIIRIVYWCNHECHFCHERENIFSLDYRSLTLGDLENIYIWLIANDFDYVVISWGEPTLHPQFVDIILYFQQKNIYVVVVNNASYLHKHDLSQIDGHKITWYVSYHGLENQYNIITQSTDYQQVTDNIIKLSETFQEVIVRHVVNSMNIETIQQFTQFSLSLSPKIYVEFVLLEDLRFSHVKNTCIPLKEFYIKVLPLLRHKRILLDGGAACITPWLFKNAQYKCDPLVNTMRGLVKKEKNEGLIFTLKHSDSPDNIKTLWKKCNECIKYKYCHGFDTFYLDNKNTWMRNSDLK